MRPHRTTIDGAGWFIANRLPFVAAGGSFTGRTDQSGVYVVTSRGQRLAWGAPQAPMTWTTSPCGPYTARHHRVVLDAVR